MRYDAKRRMRALMDWSYQFVAEPNWQQGLKEVLGHRCLLCQLPSRVGLCQLCKQQLPQLGPHCLCCANPLNSNIASLCGDCQKQPKAFRQTQASFAYHKRLRQLIHRYKRGQLHPSGKIFSELMLVHLQRNLGPEDYPDLLIPVPSHWTKLLKRGFNPAHDLATRLGASIGIRCENKLQRSATKSAQKQLNRASRLSNLEGTFHCGVHLHGQNIAVVDDVVTTAATANAVAQCLKDAGAGWVDIWCLARTP